MTLFLHADYGFSLPQTMSRHPGGLILTQYIADRSQVTSDNHLDKARAPASRQTQQKQERRRIQPKRSSVGARPCPAEEADSRAGKLTNNCTKSHVRKKLIWSLRAQPCRCGRIHRCRGPEGLHDRRRPDSLVDHQRPDQSYCYWIREADIDGFRVDAVKHMGELACVQFCSHVRQYAYSPGKRRFFLFGELA